MPINNLFFTDKRFLSIPFIKNDFSKTLEFYENLYTFIEEKVGENTALKMDYPIFDINFKQRILNFINNNDFPDEFKEKIRVFVETTANHNLVLCDQNIKNVILQKEHFNKLQMILKKEGPIGRYNSEQNKLIYSNNCINEVLGHEILHMASAIKGNKYYSCGFKYSFAFRGLNEGYTELLNRRKFFNEDFQTSCYKINVFILRILELLLQNKELLEDAYFHNDTNFVYNSFCTYSSKQEFFTLIKYLDLFCDKVIEPDPKILDLAYEIVTRTNDTEKIKQAKDFTDEYLDTTKRTKVKRKRLH